MIINRSLSSSLSNKERFGSLKSLVLLVVIAILATSNTYAQASFETIDGLSYLIYPDAKTATLTVTPGEKYSGNIVVPEKVKASDGVEYPVTALGDNAFKECSGLKSISIPSSVTSLGNYCFCLSSGLTSITIPSSVTSLGDDCFKECSELKKVTFQGKLPNNTINCGLQSTCFFFVPKAYYQDYKEALGSKYSYIYVPLNDETSGEQKPVEQCAVPTISYADGKLTFASSTPNAEYHYTITDTDMASDTYSKDGVVKLSAAYNISAYATADGYKASDKATATLYWVEANLQNTPTNINQTATRGIIVTSSDGIVTLSGLNNDETVRFYTVDGKQLGAAKAVNGTASQAVSESIVIAQMGNQTIKIAVK